MNDIRQGVAKQAEISNAKMVSWEKLKDSIYKLSDSNSVLAINLIDNLLNNDTSLDRFKISELHFVKGDIYYKIDSSGKAIDEFSFISSDNPKNLVARAGAYIKLKKFDEAFRDLKSAVNMNYDYYWNLGNYYEIINKKDSAIFYYAKLYLMGTKTYKICNDRIIELRDNNTKLLTELVFRDRNKNALVFITPVTE